MRPACCWARTLCGLLCCHGHEMGWFWVPVFRRLPEILRCARRRSGLGSARWNYARCGIPALWGTCRIHKSDALSNFTSVSSLSSANPQLRHLVPSNVFLSASLPDFVRCCVQLLGQVRSPLAGVFAPMHVGCMCSILLLARAGLILCTPMRARGASCAVPATTAEILVYI